MQLVADPAVNRVDNGLSKHIRSPSVINDGFLMRNIAADLRERFDIIATERARLEQEYKARLLQLTQREQALQVLLFEEERASGGPQPSFFTSGTLKRSENRNRSSSASLVLNILGDGMYWPSERLIAEMRNREFDFGEKAPARVLNLLLINLVK